MTSPPYPNSAPVTLDVTSVPPASAIPYQFAGVWTDLLNMSCILLGWSFYNTSGAVAAPFGLYDGNQNVRALVANDYLPANGRSAQWLGPQGVLIKSALMLNDVNVALQGTVWVVPLLTGT